MKMEHIAFNVSEPIAMAEWYTKHLGLEVARSMTTPPYTYFLRDSGGTMMMEIYCNPPDQVPRYSEMDPLLIHLAFVSIDPEADKARLLKAGAKWVQDDKFPDGTLVVMMRDPWGLPIQLCKRSKPMLL